ncbi:Alpha-tubulin suppressor [Geobacter sp. DSM 9736]|nr:Alpha-tubulin suppressor [Geobacter sp. DSM 9736]
MPFQRCWRSFAVRLVPLLATVLFLAANTAHAATPQIAAGARFTIALKSDGTLLSWGENSSGQLGEGSLEERRSPVPIPGFSGVVAIAAGNDHVVALKEDGSVWTWGGNDYGQLGNGTTTDSSTPIQVPGLSGVSAVAAGMFHTLILKTDGTVWSWGHNGYGQLGDGTSTGQKSPVKIPGVSGVSAIAAGGFHTLLLNSDGTVSACGDNAGGQLGDGTFRESAMPVTVAGLGRVVALSAGAGHSLALRDDGTVWAWGDNSRGQLGDGTTSNRALPGKVQLLEDVTVIEGGDGHSIAVKADGTVWAWGENDHGQLGDGTTGARTAPEQVESLIGILTAGCGGSHTVAITGGGSVWTWGNNSNGQLGNGDSTFKPGFVRVPNVTALRVAGGGAHTVALINDRTVAAWGKNASGQLGDGTTAGRSTPRAVIGLSNIVAVAAGADHSLALKDDGSVWTWGANYFGQLGDGTLSDSSSPIQVQGLAGIIAIAAGDGFSLALKSDGSVWGWGGNYAGQLGDGSKTDRPLPVRVTGLSRIYSIAAGYLHAVALRDDGTVWTWGSNRYGQLGDGTFTSSTVPIQAAVASVTAIAAGDNHVVARIQDKTIRAWGANESGQIGDGTVKPPGMDITPSLPVEVVGMNGVTAVAAGTSHSLAFREDGTLWGWGGSMTGELGGAGPSLIAVQLPGISNVAAISAGDAHSIVVDGAGSIWSTGNNDYGELGDGTPYLPMMLSGVFLLQDSTPPVTTAAPGEGTYLDSVTVVLRTNEPATIRCTLDGTDPTAASATYTEPITLTASTMLKCFAVDVTGNAEPVRTFSYNVQPSVLLSIFQQGTGGGTVNLAGAGSCSTSCTQAFASGSSVSLSPVADSQSLFKAWSGCDSLAGFTCMVTMNTSRTITATFNRAFPLNLSIAGSGSATVSLSTGSACSANCSHLAEEGAVVALTPLLGSGSLITSWVGCDSISGDVCSVTMSSAKNVTLNVVQRYPLDLSMSGSGTVNFSVGGSCSGACTNTYASGTTVVLNAVAVSGSILDNWQGCDFAAGTSCTVTVTSPRQVAATFAPANQLNLAFSGTGSGTVSFSTGDSCSAGCSRQVSSLATVTLTPVPSASSYFSGWSGCDSVAGNVCTVAMSSVRNVTASFGPTFQLSVALVESGTVSYSTGGSCSSNCSTAMPWGSSVVLTAVPSARTVFDGWSGCDTTNGTQCTVSMTGNRSATALFGYLVRTSLGGYPEPQEAYSAVPPAGILRLRDALFGTGLNLDRDIAVTLRGGYDSSYSTIVGMSTLSGVLTVERGTAQLEYLVIR